MSVLTAFDADVFADAVHLATAVTVRVDRFLTNNRKDFPTTIAEIDVVDPDDLPTVTSASDEGLHTRR